MTRFKLFLATVCSLGAVLGLGQVVWAATPNTCETQGSNSSCLQACNVLSGLAKDACVKACTSSTNTCKKSCNPFTDTTVTGVNCGDANNAQGITQCCQAKAGNGINTPNYCETQWKYTCKSSCDSKKEIFQSTIDCGDIKKSQGMGACCQPKPGNSPGQGNAQPGSKPGNPFNDPKYLEYAQSCFAKGPGNACTGVSQCATSNIAGPCSDDGSIVCCSATAAANTAAACTANKGTCSTGACPAGTVNYGFCTDDFQTECCVEDKTGANGGLEGLPYTTAECTSQQGTCRNGACEDLESAIGFCNQASGVTCCKIQAPAAGAGSNITSSANCFAVAGTSCVGKATGCSGGAQPIGSCDKDDTGAMAGGPDTICCAPPGADLKPVQDLSPDAFGNKSVGFDSVKSFYGYQDPLNLQGKNKGPHLVYRIITNVLPIIGALFLMVIFISGVMWFTAGGEEARAKKAKTLLVNSVIGMFIVVFAYAIVTNIISLIGGQVFPGTK